MTTTPERFYSNVSLAPVGEGELPLALSLDGKPLRTPGRRTLTIAHRRLAEAIAAEWQAQGPKVELATMPMTRLTMSVNDHVEPRVAAVQGETLAYGRTDLLCYRVAEPERLFERQAATWQPFLDWAALALGAALTATANISSFEQNPSAIDALRDAVIAFDVYQLLVLSSLTSKLGSLVLALAVLHGRTSVIEAFRISRLDEIFQAEIWGSDWAAERRTAAISQEISDLERFLSLLD